RRRCAKHATSSPPSRTSQPSPRRRRCWARAKPPPFSDRSFVHVQALASCRRTERTDANGSEHRGRCHAEPPTREAETGIAPPTEREALPSAAAMSSCLQTENRSLQAFFMGGTGLEPVTPSLSTWSR